jgi:hypothetical protein
VPVGLDLEWETDPADVSDRAGPDAMGYEIAGRAHGELLLGSDAHELDGVGWRHHRWGPIDWWAAAPVARLWVGAAGRPRARALWLTGVPGTPVPVNAAPIVGAEVEFPLPSFGSRHGTVGLAMARRRDDADAGTGWLWWRTPSPGSGS